MINDCCNLIGQGYFETQFSHLWALHWKIATLKIFQFRYFQQNLLTKFPQNSTKHLFWPILGEIQIFPKSRALSLLSPYGSITSRTKSRALSLLSPDGSITSRTISKKSNEHIPKRRVFLKNKRMDGHTRFIGPSRKAEYNKTVM